MSLLSKIKSLFAISPSATVDSSAALSDTPSPVIARSGKHWSERVKEYDARGEQHIYSAPKVSGTPTYDLAQSGKHDLAIMRACCDAESEQYWSQPEGERLCAAPYYFMRVAILEKKAKNYLAEIDICEQWRKIINDYKAQPMVKRREAALAHKGNDSIAMIARIPKAREMLRKQRALAKAKKS